MGEVIDLSDNNRLVKALKAGEEAAFKAVYLAYCGSLRAYAAVILQDAEKACEVVQDVYMAVWLHRRNLDETKPLKNYLLRAVHNNALRLLKLDLARKLREEKVMAEVVKNWNEGEESCVEKELLVAAIDKLPEQSRKVLLMSYWENKKSADIARELSISVRTAETILYKVKKKLRREMKKK